MFIEVDNYAINTDYIAYVYFYENEYTFAGCCLITLKDGEKIRLEDTNQVSQLRDTLRGVGTAVVAVEHGYDDEEGND